MTLLFIILPLITLFFGFGRVHPGYLYCGNMFFLSLLAGVNLTQVFFRGGIKKLDLGEIFRVGPDFSLGVSLGIYLDFYSSYMVWVVFTISFLVHLYSTVYMGGDPRLYTFLTYLTLFTFFIVVLLVSPNYVQLFMGWEGVGLTSYLLVNFWTTRPAANKSALKALLVNRVGDLLFLGGLFLLIREGHTLNFTCFETKLPSGVGPLFVGAAAAKSAQLGLHTWLPDAMEGPTPVSALIHAATMVTAGLFLLFRATHFVEEIRPLVGLLGGATALFAGTVALFQFDLKRVIAYSTCSQLGFMVVAYSLGSPELSLYHLGNHAFFKALLFLLAGLVIHSLADEQDMRRMGGLLKTLPLTYSLFVVGSLALGGFPFLSGFYSKDSILETLYGKGYWFVYFGCLGAAYLTAYYSFRTLTLVFGGRPRGSFSLFRAAQEADPLSLGVVLVLGFFSIFHGYFFRDLFLGWGIPLGWSTTLVEAEFNVPLGVKLAPLFFSVTAAVVYHKGWSLGWTPTGGVSFFAKRWGWDLLDAAQARRFLLKGYTLYVGVERGFFEKVGPSGVNFFLTRGYDFFRNRGWFSFFWLAGMVGFVLLALMGGEISFVAIPYFPLVGGRTKNVT